MITADSLDWGDLYARAAPRLAHKARHRAIHVRERRPE